MIDWGQMNVLVIAPHPDDEVIGAGGLISKVKAAGGAVHVLFMTVGETDDFTAHGTSTTDERVAEIERVAEHLQLDSWRIAFRGNEHHLKLDALPERELIDEIERGDRISLEALRPDVLVMPNVSDYNQDHRAAAWASMAACRPAPAADKHLPSLVLQAESPMIAWSLVDVRQPNFIVELSTRDVENKIAGMERYETQVRGPGHPRNSQTLRALVELRGSLLGVAYGEGFFAHKIAG